MGGLTKLNQQNPKPPPDSQKGLDFQLPAVGFRGRRFLDPKPAIKT